MLTRKLCIYLTQTGLFIDTCLGIKLLFDFWEQTIYYVLKQHIWSNACYRIVSLFLDMLCFKIAWPNDGFSVTDSNYANPVYGVATICHQVRWLRWGHPSLFHTAMSLLIWYKMFCVRDISYRPIWMKFINMFFPRMHNLECTVILIDKLLWF